MVNIGYIPSNRANYGSLRNVNLIKFIVVHYTANDGDHDTANANYFKNNVVKASAHYFVDDDSITMSVPDNYVAYAVGGAKWDDCSKTGGGKMYGKITNTNSLSIEMCDTKKDGKIQATDKTIANTVDLVVAKLIKYNLKPSAVYRHFDVNGKHCPAYMMNSKSWNAFLNKVKAAYNKATSNKKEEPKKETTTTETTKKETSSKYTQAKFIKDVNSILGTKSAKAALEKTVTISASTNKSHKLVTPLERYMKELGYYTGSIEADNGKTPIFGGGMTAAIKKYQKNVVKATAKNQDGVITAKAATWKKLLNV